MSPFIKTLINPKKPSYICMMELRVYFNYLHWSENYRAVSPLGF